MSPSNVVVLFPGQGAYQPGALAGARSVFPEVDGVFRAVDAVSRRMGGGALSELLFAPQPPSMEAMLAAPAEKMQLAIYAVSLAAYRVLEARGLAPAALIGHSFGEVAALAAAGVYTTEEGAEIAVRRARILDERGPKGGRMAALSAGPAQAEMLVALVGGDAAVAGENHDGQTVVSGDGARMDAAEAVARALKLSFTTLASPYPFHSPLMALAAEAFGRAIAPIRPRPGRIPVYSPILGRFYAPEDDVTSWLARHLTERVRFSDAVRAARARGATAFVECGALDALAKISRKVLNDPEVVSLAALDPSLGDAEALKAALAALGLGETADAVSPAGLLAPGTNRALFDRFWRERGAAVRDWVRRELEAFSSAEGPAPAVAAPPAAPSTNGKKAAAAPEPLPATAAAPAPAREDLLRELSALYAAALEYPPEVFTPGTALEAELGVDSVKQSELLGRVRETYALPPKAGDFRAADYDTLGKIADYVLRRGRAPAAA